MRLREALAALAESLVALGIGLAIGALLLVAYGYDPRAYYAVMFSEGFSDPSYLLEKATPLIATSLAFALPLYAGLFNIGGEGQLYIGALTALVVSLATRSLPLSLLAGIAAGALMGAVIGGLRVYRGVNEVVSSIMLNWILYYLSLYAILYYLIDPQIPNESLPVPRAARLPSIGSAPLAFILAVLSAIIAHILVYNTRIGYEMRVTGYSLQTAKYAGIDYRKAMLYSMILGGAYGGLAGTLQVLGIRYRIDVMLSSLFGLGFEGIGVALLARMNPLAMIASALFLSGLYIGGQYAEASLGAPPQVADVIIGVIIVALSVPYAYRILVSRIRARRRVLEVAGASPPGGAGSNST